MLSNRTIDGCRRAHSEPGLEHGRWPSTITRRVQITRDEHQVELITVLGPESGHAGASGPGQSRHDSKSMELAEVPERAPVDDPAAGVDGRLLTLEPLEMAAKPLLARRQEALDIALRVRPAASGRERDCFDISPSGLIQMEFRKPVGEIFLCIVTLGFYVTNELPQTALQ